MYCNSDNALAGLIREIRNVSLYVPGFQLCELEEFVYVAQGLNSGVTPLICAVITAVGSDTNLSWAVLKYEY